MSARDVTPQPIPGRWTSRGIATVRENIRAELERIGSADGPKARLRYILGRIDQEQNSLDPASLLRCFVYIVSAIVHSARRGGLTTRDESRLAATAHGILRLQNIKAGKSLHSGLYGDLHLALSNAMRRRGHHWKAAWEQAMAYNLSRAAPPGGHGFQLLSAGTRALRLGHAQSALQHLVAAREAGLTQSQLILAELNRIMALRLAGRLHEAATAMAAAAELCDSEAAAATELAWNHLALGAQQTGALDAMIRAVSRHGTHHTAVYLIEAWFWSHAVRSTAWTDRFPMMRWLGNIERLHVRSRDPFHHAARGFEECLDDSVPFASRLSRLGEILDSLHTLISVDKELLVLAAACRWLARNNAYHLAALTLTRYRSISMTLMDGTCGDALGILGDMLAKDWFREHGIRRSSSAP